LRVRSGCNHFLDQTDLVFVQMLIRVVLISHRRIIAS
jgi:hypothetical protein